ncbi:short-chain alcohol dehydrogenase [Taxawa tesnikishii (nom. ined.)]|nr:short-chain alcohol dehydrogenase [Dothideales sp. JES 119]
MSIPDFKNIFYQCFYIPKPTLTEENLPDQSGRVFIVTGGYAGVGLELSRILYQRNGTVYIAGRSEAKGAAAISSIKSKCPSSDGRLEFLHLDLADLATIKASAEAFLARERRLDVLTNNAGVMVPPSGSRTAQGHELQIGTNCLGPYLFTRLLLPVLQRTAAAAPPGSGEPVVHGTKMANYAQSKAGNVLLAHEFLQRYGGGGGGHAGIVSNAWNPGNLVSELQRHQSWYEAVFVNWLRYPSVLGAYTELFAGWADEAGKEENKGKYVLPWGRFGPVRADLDKGANGKSVMFWEWCERETASYA